MRRMLISGAAAAIALLPVATTAEPALAGQHKAEVLTNSCSDRSPAYLSVTANRTNYYLGTPNKVTRTSVAILKSAMNGSTVWTSCFTSTGLVTLVQKQGRTWYALTTRATAAGQDVTVEKTSNNGSTGAPFMSQLWIVGGTTSITLQSQNTKLYLRIRNSGPKMYQSVTTGQTPTEWTDT